MITNFRSSIVTITKQDIINGSGWYYISSNSSSSLRRDTISLKMKKLIDLTYLSCLCIVKNNLGGAGCTGYKTSSGGYIIQKFDINELKYYVFSIEKNALSAEINSNPLEMVDTPRLVMSVNTFDKIKDIIGKTFNELEKLGKEWQATTII